MGRSSVYLWIAAGSGIGGALRYGCYGLSARFFGETFPWGTLIVNVAGSAFIGFFAGATGPDGRFLVSSPARLFVMAGVCGGFTTFSTFSLETLNLVHAGEFLKALLNITGTLLLCLGGVWAGYTIAAIINER